MVTPTTINKFVDDSEDDDEASMFNNPSIQKFDDISSWGQHVYEQGSNFNIIHLNIRSLRKNYAEFLQLMKACNYMIKIAILTEINIAEEELPMYKIAGYNMYSRTRKGKRGGGILMYSWENINVKIEVMNMSQMEIMFTKTSFNTYDCNIISIYRPPQSNREKFIEELVTVLESIPSGQDVILIGDMNINTIEETASNITSKYMNTLCERGFMCLVNDVTREEIVSGSAVSSCIDHLWVRSRRQSHAHLLACRISDHYLIGGNIETNVCYGREEVVKSKSILSNSRVKEQLDKIDWEVYADITDPIQIYNRLYADFTHVYSYAEIEVTPSRSTAHPWADTKALIMIDRKNELFRKWKSLPKNMNFRLEYTRYRNKTNKYINKIKDAYKRGELKQCNGNIRKIWQKVNNWLGRETNNIDNVIKKYLGKNNDILHICNSFGKSFATEIIDIRHDCSVKLLDRSGYVNECDSSFRFTEVSPREVMKVINGLSVHKSPGIDKIRARDLKYVKDKISPILAKFINLCVKHNAYPSLLKVSLIRPIYKQGSHLDYSNYRPISILSVINIITEKVIVSQLSKFLEARNALSEVQHGFRPGRSTTSALLCFSDYVNDSLHERKHVVVVFIDFRRAFETLDHVGLIQAMSECGVRGPISEFFKTYHTGRQLQVLIAGTTGSLEKTEFGVPTGSVYGPLGYVMHVNSLCNVVEKCRMYMYADDTCLIYADSDLVNAVNKVQIDFNNICKWAHDNGLVINLSKTKCMYIHSPYMKEPRESVTITGHSYDCFHQNFLLCRCTPLECVSSYKYLGMIVDCHMSWKLHIGELCAKLRLMLTKFYYLRNVVSRSTMRCLYYALVDSLLGYGLSCWGGIFKTHLEKVKRLHIRIIKQISSKKVITTCKSDRQKLYKNNKVLPIERKFKLHIIKDNINRKELFKPITHSSPTRTQRNWFSRPVRINNYYGKRSMKYLVPVTCNGLPFCVTEVSSVNVLKKRLKQYFLESIT